MENPCHKTEIKNLKRVEGQIKGIQTMVSSNEYCVDILNQIKAAKAALSSIETKILNKHIKECVKSSLVSEEGFENKLQELTKILKR